MSELLNRLSSAAVRFEDDDGELADTLLEAQHEIQRLRDFATEIRDNYDHDQRPDCRVCEAGFVLRKARRSKCVRRKKS